MRKLLVLPILFLLIGCPQPTDQTARDSIAAAHGWVVNAQATWSTTCRANPTQIQCTSTNKLIAAEHAAADALVVYCAGTPANGATAYANGGACVPVKSAASVLQSAVLNLNSIVTDVKNLLSRPN